MNLLYRIINSLKRALLYNLRKRRFRYISKTAYIVDDKMLTSKHISIGDNAIIWYNCRIEGIEKYYSITYHPHIEIRSGVKIQQNVHITCANSVIIDKNTCVSAGVTITDINHPYTDIDVPIEKQNLEVKSVYIGPDSKIYNGVVVLPGTRIGKHCVIGANSVVTHDIPDYCVAVGAPAHVVKRYDFETKKWKNTDENGNFIIINLQK